MNEKCGACEYQMTKEMANELLKARKGADKNLRPQDYLIKHINEEFGLLYNCVKVVLV